MRKILRFGVLLATICFNCHRAFSFPWSGDGDAAYQRATSSGASTRIELRVIDDDGKPVSDVDVRAIFSLGADFNTAKFKTDANGIVQVEGKTTGNSIVIRLCKDKYYYSKLTLKYLKSGENRKVEDNKWQPFGEKRIVRLRRIQHPINLIRFEKNMSVPETNVWIGLDLRLGDWVKPYGNAEETDLEVRVLWDGKSPEYSRYCKTEARFVKPMSGFYELRNVMESKMPYPYEANTNATYGLNFEYYDRKNGAKMRKELLPNDNWVLRVRCEMTKDGRLKCANYCGLRCLEASPGMAGEKAVLSLESVFNPTPNDTNLEDMDIAQRTHKQIELDKRLEKERREKEAKTVWGGIKKIFDAP